MIDQLSVSCLDSDKLLKNDCSYKCSFVPEDLCDMPHMC